MKVVSYNIWNNDTNYSKRIDLLVSLLKDEEIDILALQEVRDINVVQRIKNECQFEHYYWKEYFDCIEGLAVLSKYPIISSWTNWDDTEDVHNSGIMNVILNIDGLKIGVTNVHLDYKHSYNREIEIVKAVKMVEELEVDYNMMLGDFNTYPNSVIHSYLSGCQSIMEHSTSWIDLAEAYSLKYGATTEITLDFYNNPRWDKEYTLEIPGRFDWIMLKNPYPSKCPMLKDYRLIGNHRINGITPSDHYGVLCNIKI